MNNYTIEDKYNFLVSKMKVTDIDLWEKDALLRCVIYFQMKDEEVPSVEEAIELAMKDWFRLQASVIETS